MREIARAKIHLRPESKLGRSRRARLRACGTAFNGADASLSQEIDHGHCRRNCLHRRLRRKQLLQRGTQGAGFPFLIRVAAMTWRRSLLGSVAPRPGLCRSEMRGAKETMGATCRQCGSPHHQNRERKSAPRGTEMIRTSHFHNKPSLRLQGRNVNQARLSWNCQVIGPKFFCDHRWRASGTCGVIRPEGSAKSLLPSLP